MKNQKKIAMKRKRKIRDSKDFKLRLSANFM
jgi:hypothetical protein